MAFFILKIFCHDFKIISLNNMYSEQNLKIITYYDINKLESLTLDTLSNCNMIEELFKLIIRINFIGKMV
ncbi:hypothetical protein B5G36_04220 [Ligilactobacillus salivarius]|uniref:Uncharacterized protein n=1 Tax=Ligilactobacillus salivarius TaxID=1624 RepID=A0AB36MHT8_9LACO|nr:hypothetical protein B5G36_04220 [Ligilactobacillus salivarius]